MKSLESLSTRIRSRIEVQPNGCWHWTGSIMSKGYGRIYIDGRQVYAHRLVYSLLVGPIPDGLTIDHLCHNRDADCNLDNLCPHRRCINPAHLEAVTVKVNILRGKAPPARRSRSVTCHRGHLLSGDNLYLTKDGRRVCRECSMTAQAERRASHREESRKHARERYQARREADSSFLARQAANKRAYRDRKRSAEEGTRRVSVDVVGHVQDGRIVSPDAWSASSRPPLGGREDAFTVERAPSEMGEARR